MKSENSYLKRVREKELRVIKPLTEAQKECLGHIIDGQTTKEGFIDHFGPLGRHILEELIRLKQVDLIDGVLYIGENDENINT